HIIDMARFITGDEVTEIIGSVAETFIKERKIVESGPKGGIAGGTSGGGEKGSVRFDFEDMNYLDFYDATAPRKQQGWTRIMVTHGGDHPYVGNWWPD